MGEGRGKIGAVGEDARPWGVGAAEDGGGVGVPAGEFGAAGGHGLGGDRVPFGEELRMVELEGGGMEDVPGERGGADAVEDVPRRVSRRGDAEEVGGQFAHLRIAGGGKFRSQFAEGQVLAIGIQGGMRKGVAAIGGEEAADVVWVQMRQEDVGNGFGSDAVLAQTGQQGAARRAVARVDEHAVGDVEDKEHVARGRIGSRGERIGGRRAEQVGEQRHRHRLGRVLVAADLELVSVGRLEHFAKMCGHKVRRCDILSRPNLLRGWKPHLRKPPTKWLQ